MQDDWFKIDMNLLMIASVMELLVMIVDYRADVREVYTPVRSVGHHKFISRVADDRQQSN